MVRVSRSASISDVIVMRAVSAIAELLVQTFFTETM